MLMNPEGPGTKNGCADEGQQQFTRTEAVFKGLLWHILESRSRHFGR
jgi:hypothetical protein